MNFDHLRYFCTLYEVGQHGEAAKILHIAPSTLSNAIDRLESELGVSLFSQQGKALRATEYGVTFYDYVRRGMDSINQGREIVRERADAENATLKIGTIYAIQDRSWSEALHRFSVGKNCGMHIDILQGFTQDLIPALESRKIDVAFCGMIGEHSALASIPCWSQELVLAVNRNHFLAKRKVVSLDELKGFRLLSYQRQSTVACDLPALVRGHDLDIEYLYNDEISLCSLVTGDKNTMALLAYSFLVNSFKDVRLLRIAEAPLDFHRTYLTYRRVDYGRPKIVDEFISFMRNVRFPPAMLA